MRHSFSGPASTLVATVARRLEPCLDKFVFVGGQVTELLITSAASTGARPTYDVDLVVPVATRGEYAALEESLRDLGLLNDTSEGAPLCRWITPEQIVVDIMPTDEAILGFSNRWYPEVLARPMNYELEQGLSVSLPTPPLFLATKWEAHRDRGSADPLQSADLEDIITVVAGRPEIVAETASEPVHVRAWLGEQTRMFLAGDTASYVISGALNDARIVPGIEDEVRERLSAVAALADSS